ncbi:MAG: tryptophan synthase subunit alpha [Planctomycetes bacterium]|nr:tryptophan synthase subunit alpha [Planctomycetota bacterium]
MSAIDDLFRRLKSEGRKALMPFVTAGDPDLKFTAELLAELSRSGGDLCELGIPYSDPIADGPVIQASYTRALGHHIRLVDIFATLKQTTSSLAAPLVTMVSFAIVHRHGLSAYVDDAKRAGVAGLIVPDLPVEESGPLADACRGADLSLVQLITPTTPQKRAERIAAAASGFIYYVSVTGITGERTELPKRLVDDLAALKKRTELPICVGFGISTPEHVRLLKPVADGLIVGSAIVRRVAECGAKPREQVLAEIGQYTAMLRKSMDTP